MLLIALIFFVLSQPFLVRFDGILRKVGLLNWYNLTSLINLMRLFQFELSLAQPSPSLSFFYNPFAQNGIFCRIILANNYAASMAEYSGKTTFLTFIPILCQFILSNIWIFYCIFHAIFSRLYHSSSVIVKVTSTCSPGRALMVPLESMHWIPFPDHPLLHSHCQYCQNFPTFAFFLHVALGSQ